MEVGGDLGVERRDFGDEGGHEGLRRQHDADGAEVLFADFGEGVGVLGAEVGLDAAQGEVRDSEAAGRGNAEC